MRSVLTNALFWLAVLSIALGALVFLNFHKPKKPVLHYSPPKKLLVACFLEGNPVFTGEVLGDVKVHPDKKISFFSVELNAEVLLVNGSCMVMHPP